MDFSDVRNHLDESCDFPVDHGEVIERVGHVGLDAPGVDSETIETALNRTERTTYRSPDDVVTTLRGTVGDAYVGRKHYDDRSGARALPDDRRVLSV